MTVAGLVSRVGRELAGTFLPSWCVVCDRELPWRNRVGSCCRACWDALPEIRTVKCTSCALPLPVESAATCIACQLDPTPLDWCDSWGHYSGGLEPLIHAYKFARHDFLAAPLSELMTGVLRQRADLRFDAVVPVPMSRNKERRRGYNQAELLARGIARAIGVPCRAGLLSKTVERSSQSLLPRDQRAANVRGAFAASKQARGREILLVDDICTTAETLRACAGELLREDAARVSAITLAKAS